MTNAAKVKELCRQIRGIASDYPDGFATVVAQVDALREVRTLTPVTVTIGCFHKTEGASIPEAEPTSTSAGPDCIDRAITGAFDAAWEAARQATQPKQHPLPDSALNSQPTQQVRRGPGRPKKVRTEG